jgi:hypothetical protein
MMMMMMMMTDTQTGRQTDQLTNQPTNQPTNYLPKLMEHTHFWVASSHSVGQYIF